MTRQLRLKDINIALTMLFEEVKSRKRLIIVSHYPVIVHNVRDCSA